MEFRLVAQPVWDHDAYGVQTRSGPRPLSHYQVALSNGTHVAVRVIAYGLVRRYQRRLAPERRGSASRAKKRADLARVRPPSPLDPT